MASPLWDDTVQVPSFVIPPVFDSLYYNKPDLQSVLVHSYSSSFTFAGLQAVLCFHPQPILPSHLGLPHLETYEDKVFLQAATQDQPFLLQTHAANGQSLQINITEYLILLQFVAKEWPRLESKLDCQLTSMKEGTDPINITGHLVFYNHGSSFFRTNLSSRLIFKAWIDSHQDQKMIHACLEKKLDFSDVVEQMPLPMNSLLTMAQDALGMKILSEMMAYYKSRMRKRPRPVV